VPCPVCRRVLEIPKKGLDELPHNFFVQNLIEAREASTEQPHVVLCEACDKYGGETEGDIPPATMYCVDCNQKLCERCSRPHKAMKGGPHQVRELGSELSVELIQQRGSYCEQHAGKQLELYCFDCKTNVCMKCFAVKHTHHKCCEVEAVAEDLVKSSKADAQQVSKRTVEFQAAITQTDEGKSRLIRTVQDVKTSVKERGEALKRTVDRQVDSLIGQLQAFERSSQKELASRKEGLELGITAMESFTAYSLELMSKGSPCDITRAASELHARADELLKTYATAVDYCAPGVKFVPMNIDELTEPRHGDDQNLIGRILTSNSDGKLSRCSLISRHYKSHVRISNPYPYMLLFGSPSLLLSFPYLLTCFRVICSTNQCQGLLCCVESFHAFNSQQFESCYFLWPPYGIGQAFIFLPCGFFLLSFFSIFLA